MNQPMETSKLGLTVGSQVLTATLYDNATTRDFIALLPLTLTLQDYAGMEKVSDLPAQLSTQDAPAGHEPTVGDLTYFAPWGNLALFYRDFRYASGLVAFGRLDTATEIFRTSAPVRVKLELLPS
jgi:hypothetical protein